MGFYYVLVINLFKILSAVMIFLTGCLPSWVGVFLSHVSEKGGWAACVEMCYLLSPETVAWDGGDLFPVKEVNVFLVSRGVAHVPGCLNKSET